MDSIKGLRQYVRSSAYRTAMELPEEQVESYELLAHGEYNINYIFTHPVWGRKLLLRVECGSQMHLDNQIEYEAKALRLLEGCGRTPRVYYYDASKELLDHGVLVEQYLPGRSLDYNNEEELIAVAHCLADIHSLKTAGNNHLIAPENSLEAIIEESDEMIRTYYESPLADEAVKERIRKLLAKGREVLAHTASAMNVRCIINTELNNTNFLVDGQGEELTAYLIDWEKPLYGDPAQDLGHFLTPTTTFWKTEVMWDADRMNWFIDRYLEAVDGRYDTSGLRERALLLATMTCLRGITWCAMAWVQYQEAGKKLVNESTRIKLGQYLSDPLLTLVEELFDAL